MTCHDIPWTAHVSNWIHLCSRAKLLELSLPLLSVSFLSAALTALIGLLLIFTLATFALQGLRIQGSFLQDLCWDLCWNLSSWLQSLERLMSFMPATAAHAYVQALRHTHTHRSRSKHGMKVSSNAKKQIVDHCWSTVHSPQVWVMQSYLILAKIRKSNDHHAWNGRCLLGTTAPDASNEPSDAI